MQSYTAISQEVTSEDTEQVARLTRYCNKIKALIENTATCDESLAQCGSVLSHQFPLRKYGSVKIVDRLGMYDPRDVLTHIHNQHNTFDGIKVNTNQRYEVLAKGLLCKTCGLEATVAFLEKVESKNHTGHTINFYGIRLGQLVYFTKDHRIPKSKGGADSMENYDTMCWTCNHTKADKTSAPEAP